MLSAVKIKGSFRGWTGYDHHVRKFILELHRRGINIELEDHPEWSAAKLASPEQSPFFEQFNVPVNATVKVHFCLPHQVQLQQGVRNINFTMFEADRIPNDWVNHNLRHDLLIVPTKSSSDAWVNSGYPEENIRLCPLGVESVDFSHLNTYEKSFYSLISKYTHRFLNVSELRPRKNLTGLIKSWLISTNKDSDAILVMKIGNCQSKFYNEWLHDLDTVQHELGKNIDEAAPILFITDFLTQTELQQLYSTCSHYVSVSFGEGWDLPMMEAGASGLQLIAPNHTSYLTYLDPTIAHLIPVKKVPVRIPYTMGKEDGIFFQGANWWEPDLQYLSVVIRRIINVEIHPKENPSEIFLSNYSWEKSCDKLLNILNE